MTDCNDDLRPEELEALRDEVIAHVASLPPAKRNRLGVTFDATLARIDARLVRARNAPATGSAADDTDSRRE